MSDTPSPGSDPAHLGSDRTPADDAEAPAEDADDRRDAQRTGSEQADTNQEDDPPA